MDFFLLFFDIIMYIPVPMLPSPFKTIEKHGTVPMLHKIAGYLE